MAVHGEKRFVSVTLEFEYREDPVFPEDVYLELSGMHRDTDMNDDELTTLGESVAQTDRWQVEHWSDIQRLLGGSSARIKYELGT